MNAKYWDEGAALTKQNSRIAGRAGIELEDFNRMEIAFMRGVDWTLALSLAEYEEWASKLDAFGAEAMKEQEKRRELGRRNESPLLSTDVVERLAALQHKMLRPASTFSSEDFASCDVSTCDIVDVLETGAEEEEPNVMHLSSTPRDVKGSFITTRLVFPTLPSVDGAHGREAYSGRGDGGNTILRVCSVDELTREDSDGRHACGGGTILRTVSMWDVGQEEGKSGGSVMLRATSLVVMGTT